MEPERKYIIKEVWPELNDIIFIRGELEDISIVLEDLNKKNELIYEVESDGYYNIFGYFFVENNKNNINLIINGEEHQLKDEAYLKKGKNTIKLIANNKMTNTSKMFGNIKTLNFESLKDLDVSEVTDFSEMFYECSLSNLNGLKNWNVSHGQNFKEMFKLCSSLSNINGLKNWNVSHGQNFEGMFCDCILLSNLNGLQNWNISNA